MKAVMTPEQAEMIAIQALSHIAGDEDLLSALLDSTGLYPSDLLARAAEPEILGGVLDFILADEQRLLAFCDMAAVAPQIPAQARKLLPGGAEAHWT